MKEAEPVTIYPNREEAWKAQLKFGLKDNVVSLEPKPYDPVLVGEEGVLQVPTFCRLNHAGVIVDISRDKSTLGKISLWFYKK